MERRLFFKYQKRKIFKNYINKLVIFKKTQFLNFNLAARFN